MKLTTLMPMVVLGAKVPRDSPVRKILKLKRFANEWLSRNFPKDGKVHKHWNRKILQNVNRFKKRFENCGNTEVEYVAKVMADHKAAQEAAQGQQQVRKRRAKGGQGGSRGRGKGGKGGKNRPPKEAKIPTEFRKYDKSNPGIADIMKGFGIWSKRYVSKCKNQPATQENRADVWTAKLQEKLNTYNERSARQAARAAKNN